MLPWVGGKKRCAKSIVACFPTDIRTYHEPFLGGGSVLFQVLHAMNAGRLNVMNVYASDSNVELIHMYIQVQQNPFDFFRHLQTLQIEWDGIQLVNGNRHPTSLEEALHSKEAYYYWIQADYNAMGERVSPLRAAYFMFLTRTGLRGISKAGTRGFGHMNRVAFIDEDQIRNIHQLIQPVLFQVQSYQEAFSWVREGDMVYMDPPGITTDFSFNKHLDLVYECSHLPCAWMLSPSSDTIHMFNVEGYEAMRAGPRHMDMVIKPRVVVMNGGYAHQRRTPENV